MLQKNRTLKNNFLRSELGQLRRNHSYRIIMRPKSARIPRYIRRYHMFKRVRFDKKRNRVYTLPRYKDSRKSPWEQLAKDHERFQRCIMELKNEISRIISEKRIQMMNNLLGPILQNHLYVYVMDKMSTE